MGHIMYADKHLVGATFAATFAAMTVFSPASFSAEQFMHGNLSVKSQKQKYHSAVSTATDSLVTGSLPDDPLKKKYKRPDRIPFPEHNTYSDAKASLGKKLFFDRRWYSKYAQVGEIYHRLKFTNIGHTPVASST